MPRGLRCRNCGRRAWTRSGPLGLCSISGAPALCRGRQAWVGSWDVCPRGCRGPGSSAALVEGALGRWMRELRGPRPDGRTGSLMTIRGVGRAAEPPPLGTSWRPWAQSSLAVSPRREEVEPKGSRPTPCLVPDKQRPRWTLGPAAGGLGPCRAWPPAEPAPARCGQKRRCRA